MQRRYPQLAKFLSDPKVKARIHEKVVAIKASAPMKYKGLAFESVPQQPWEPPTSVAADPKKIRAMALLHQSVALLRTAEEIRACKKQVVVGHPSFIVVEAQFAEGVAVLLEASAAQLELLTEILERHDLAE